MDLQKDADPNQFNGKAIRVEYLPTKRSRKWQMASVYIKAFDASVHGNLALRLATENDWHDARLVASLD